jgi:RNA-directed DNA polymerase
MPKTAKRGAGKSEQAIVPEKQSNEAPLLQAWVTEETAEERACAKRNLCQQNTRRTQSRNQSVPSELVRVRQRAKQDKKARFTSLLHHLSLERWRAAFERLKPNAAAGVDDVHWRDYREGLEQRLQNLHARLHSGRYRARPARRAYIPKADGRQRALGIAALEDKIIQAAVAEMLNAIYEVDFLGFSYGFRPGRNQHQALDALTVGLKQRKINWVLDADIRGFFDTIDHAWLCTFLQHRIGDRRVLRLIQKWLKAGVLEGGRWQPSHEGTPQGSVISPLLANVYLHYVFDLWANQWRKRHAHGEVIIVRYADDFIVGFQHRSDADTFFVELGKRLGKFALQLHGEKTRLIEFGRFAAERRGNRKEGKPPTFDFLGLTHMCSRTEKGEFAIRRKTALKRRHARLKAIGEELRKRRHQAIAEQGTWLGSVLRGYFAYHAVPGNTKVLKAFRMEVSHRWYRSLRRRSQKKRLNWTKMGRFVNRWLPQPRMMHPWPEQRFAANTQGKSPVR